MVPQGKKRVWRQHNTRYEPKNTVGTVKHSKKINVWGCFSAYKTFRFSRIEGIMDSKIFAGIVKSELIPSMASAERMFPPGCEYDEVIYQQDNDPKHTSTATRALFEEKGIVPMDWPSQSPDLNPIENLWSILDYQCKLRRPQSEDELFAILKEAWDNIPGVTVKSLVDSMHRRCEAVIAAKGFMTKY